MKIFFLVLMLCVVGFQPLEAKSKKRSSRSVQAIGGAPIDGFGFSIDASYDPGLNGLVPGYRVVNVAIVNGSYNILILNPEEDKWFVRTNSKKKIPALIDLRNIDPEAWAQVPQRARQLMAYPLAIPIGAQLVVDLFLPEEVKLEYLTEVIMELGSFGGVPFEIKVRED